MANPLARIFAWCFVLTVVAYTIMYCLYVYEGVAVLTYPTMSLELVVYVNFVMFALNALQGIALRWLWVALAFIAEVVIPAGASLLITTKLAALNAPPPWWYATTLLVCILKLAVAAAIVLWRRSRSPGVADAPA